MFAGAIINAGAATVDHDCEHAKGVHISLGAHLADGVTVGAGNWAGIDAAIRQQIRIGQDAIIGAGAAVAITVVGTPAPPLIRS